MGTTTTTTKKFKVTPSSLRNHSVGITESNANVLGMVMDGHAFCETLTWCRVRMETSMWMGVPLALHWWGGGRGLAWNRPESRPLL